MPAEIFDTAEFIRLSETAIECRVKKSGDIVKLKLRTPRKLYTMKLEPAEAEGVLKEIKCGVVEV